MLAKLDGLRHVVFGYGEIFCRQAANGIALLVFDDDSFDYELHLHRHGVGVLRVGRAILADLLRGGGGGEDECEKHGGEFAHGQNLTRMVACRLRMALTDCGRPNCALSNVVTQLLKTA